MIYVGNNLALLVEVGPSTLSRLTNVSAGFQRILCKPPYCSKSLSARIISAESGKDSTFGGKWERAVTILRKIKYVKFHSESLSLMKIRKEL